MCNRWPKKGRSVCRLCAVLSVVGCEHQLQFYKIPRRPRPTGYLLKFHLRLLHTMQKSDRLNWTLYKIWELRTSALFWVRKYLNFFCAQVGALLKSFWACKQLNGMLNWVCEWLNGHATGCASCIFFQVRTQPWLPPICVCVCKGCCWKNSCKFIGGAHFPQPGLRAPVCLSVPLQSWALLVFLIIFQS